jgi:AcrR family transcriptional regulator
MSMTGRSSSHRLNMPAMELAATQEQTLDKAMSCIGRDGIDGASVRNVAREADVSLGLLSYHFDDKRCMIVATFELSTSKLFIASVASLIDVDGADEGVRAYIRGAFRGEILDPQYLALRVALWAISPTGPEIETVERHLYERYANQLTALIAQARPKPSAIEARRPCHRRHRHPKRTLAQLGTTRRSQRPRTRTRTPRRHSARHALRPAQVAVAIPPDRLFNRPVPYPTNPRCCE